LSDRLIGSLRVSRDNDQHTTDLHRDAVLAVGVEAQHLCEDKASGARRDQPGLAQALASGHRGDCLVVWKRDRLGRSLPHLLDLVTRLQARGVALRSLTTQRDTTTTIPALHRITDEVASCSGFNPVLGILASLLPSLCLQHLRNDCSGFRPLSVHEEGER
jgi:resolvase-like protein